VPLDLIVRLFDDGSALVIPAFWANGMGGHGVAALRTITHLTSFDVVMRSAFTGSAVGMFSFGDGHLWGSIERGDRLI